MFIKRRVEVKAVEQAILSSDLMRTVPLYAFRYLSSISDFILSSWFRFLDLLTRALLRLYYLCD
jgi:hypothetical protein